MKNALKNAIDRISEEFLVEARNSPRLLEDMAAMEKYMAESYSGRVFVELLQNADDAQSSNICLRTTNGHLYFANNGRGFEERDVVAISRSGSSSKEKGTAIGYRGVGFKSTTYLSNDIIIHSDETYFTFSKTESAKLLNLPVEKTPTVRIPLPLFRIDEDVENEIDRFVAEGYTTVFIFKNANISDFRLEIDDIENGYFLFLNHIKRCSIQVDNLQRAFCIDRHKHGLDSLIEIGTDEKQEWLVRSNGVTSVAFKYEDGRIAPCSNEEAKYHCYLPTIDTAPFPCKINSAFSTDPSRKHLVYDNHTKGVLLEVAELFFDVLCVALNNPHENPFCRIIEILSMQLSFSLPNAEIIRDLKTRITNYHWLLINNGQSISASEYMQLPDWLENSEKTYLRENAPTIRQVSLQNEAYINIPNIDTYLSQFSQNRLDEQDLVKIMEDKALVSSLSERTCGKILANIARAANMSEMISKVKLDLGNVYVKTEDQTISVAEIKKDQKLRVASSIAEQMSDQLSKSDANWFALSTQLDTTQFLITEKPCMHKSAVQQKSLGRAVRKWRTAEEQCIDIEKCFSNFAQDVSKQNLGYDVDSTTSDGMKRYIEVKSVAAGEEFCMTNNEYTAAHQYGDQYYLCLIEETSNSINVTYIKNPLKYATFQKRVRQWEWLCTEYSGETYRFDFNEVIR